MHPQPHSFEHRRSRWSPLFSVAQTLRLQAFLLPTLLMPMLLLEHTPALAQGNAPTLAPTRTQERLEIRLLDQKFSVELQQLKAVPSLFTHQGQRLELRRLDQGIEVKLNGTPLLDARLLQPLPSRETCTLWIERVPSPSVVLGAEPGGEGCDDAPEPPCAEEGLQLAPPPATPKSSRAMSPQNEKAPTPTVRASLRCVPRA